MSHLNYHHLKYFYLTAKHGTIIEASKLLHVTPQTVSSQIAALETQLQKKVFERQGKRLKLNAVGETVFHYAKSIFATGDDLLLAVAAMEQAKKQTFVIGSTDAVPKMLVYKLFSPMIEDVSNAHFVFREGGFDVLLTELALGRVDLILADKAVMAGAKVKARSILLGESSLGFFASPQRVTQIRSDFPRSLNNVPMLLPGDRNSLRPLLMEWLQEHNVVPNVIAEFDDSATLKLFGLHDSGIFCAPLCIRDELEQQYNVALVKQIDLQESFYVTTTGNQDKSAMDKLKRLAAAILG
ncbi:LysR family transcriptional regulator [Alteromonas aestuariivivens]|nr:LysR family transcriptional regulator [Alteromonas aestuariivivens]